MAPTSRLTPSPAGEPLAEEYKRALDPFVALGAAAAVTTELRIGTGIALVAQRDPVVLAKEVASLDLVSGGRFVFGIGYGWNVEEMATHGVDFGDRRELVREKIELMSRLWADDEAVYAGDRVELEASWSWPKPMQAPHPPIFVGGGGGPKLFAAIADYADGWMPIGAAGVRDKIPELRRAYEQADRDPESVRVIPFGSIPDQAKVEYFASLGIDEVVVRLPPADKDTVLRVLDRYADLVE